MLGNTATVAGTTLHRSESPSTVTIEPYQVIVKIYHHHLYDPMSSSYPSRSHHTHIHDVAIFETHEPDPHAKHHGNSLGQAWTCCPLCSRGVCIRCRAAIEPRRQ